MCGLWFVSSGHSRRRLKKEKEKKEKGGGGARQVPTPRGLHCHCQGHDEGARRAERDSDRVGWRHTRLAK